MKKSNIPEAMGILVSSAAVAVMLGWFLGIEILKSILPVWVSMKFCTAISFFLCGIMLYFVARYRKKERELAVLVIPLASMVVILLMSSLLISTALGINTGVEELFVKDSLITVESVTPGRPSIATMLNFILIAALGMLSVMQIKGSSKVTDVFGLIAAMVGLVAVFGYIIGEPLLYFSVSGKSSAMAIHTAILFVLLGAGLVLLERNK